MTVYVEGLDDLSQGRLASTITREQGKTLADAEGDVQRGLRK